MSQKFPDSQTRLDIIKKKLLSKKVGFSKNYRQKIEAVSELAVFKNKRYFKRETVKDGSPFYRFVKETMTLDRFTKPDCIAVRDYQLNPNEIISLCSYISQNNLNIRFLILDNTSDVKADKGLWELLTGTRINNIETLSLSCENEDTKIVVDCLIEMFKPEQNNNSNEPSAKLTSLFLRDFTGPLPYKQELSLENLILRFSKHLIKLHIERSPILFKMMEEVVSKMSRLQFLTVSSVSFNSNMMFIQLAEMRNLKLLGVDNVRYDNLHSVRSKTQTFSRKE